MEKVLVSKKISFGEKIYKCFIGYLYHDHKVKPLHIMLPKTSAYVKRYDGQNIWMYFLFKDDGLLEKYNAIWDKVSADIKREFDSEPVCNKVFLKIKIKPQGDEITDFYNKSYSYNILSQQISNHTCLAVISFDFALRKDDNYIIFIKTSVKYTF